MTITCACWRCTGKAVDDGTSHMTTGWTTLYPLPVETHTWNPDPPRPPDTDLSCCELACYEDPGCTCEGCRLDDDSHPEAVIAWVAVMALAWLAVGVIGWIVVRRG